MKLKSEGSALVVGGTSGVGLALGRRLAGEGLTVHLAGRDPQRAAAVAREVEGNVLGIGLDLAEPSTIAPALSELGEVDYVVLAAMERDGNHVATYDAERAVRTVTIKMVGYTEVLHALVGRLPDHASVLLFGGAAFLRPSAGSVTTAAIGAGVIGLARSLATQLAPVRVNAIHPGVVGDSPALSEAWGEERMTAEVDRTPIGRLVTTDEVVDASIALLANAGINGVSLMVDGGWVLT